MSRDDGTLLDRRRVELVDEDLPEIPNHSEGQALPLHEAVALVEHVRVSKRHVMLGLDVSYCPRFRLLRYARHLSELQLVGSSTFS